MTAACPLRCKEQPSGPESVAGLEEAMIEPQGKQRCPLPPPGFRPLPPGSEPPLLEEEIPLIGIPNPEEAQVYPDTNQCHDPDYF